MTFPLPASLYAGAIAACAATDAALEAAAMPSLEAEFLDAEADHLDRWSLWWVLRISECTCTRERARVLFFILDRLVPSYETVATSGGAVPREFFARYRVWSDAWMHALLGAQRADDAFDDLPLILPALDDFVGFIELYGKVTQRYGRNDDERD